MTTTDADLRAAVEATWRDVLDAGPIGPDIDFVVLGGDSMMLMEVLLRLEAIFPHVEFDDVDPFDFATVETTVAFLRRARAS